jgi:hypothetical protein
MVVLQGRARGMSGGRRGSRQQQREVLCVVGMSTLRGSMCWSAPQQQRHRGLSDSCDWAIGALDEEQEPAVRRTLCGSRRGVVVLQARARSMSGGRHGSRQQQREVWLLGVLTIPRGWVCWPALLQKRQMGLMECVDWAGGEHCMHKGLARKLVSLYRYVAVAASYCDWTACQSGRKLVLGTFVWVARVWVVGGG